MPCPLAQNIPLIQLSPIARSTHVQLPSSSVVTSPSSAATAETTIEKKLKSNEIWAASTINVLLDLYEDKWITINQGNFKAKHWAEIARGLNACCGTEFEETQCKYKWENMKRTFIKETEFAETQSKYKWENMKRTFIKEKQKEEKSNAEPSRWEFFSRWV
ncbi:hypothetical protein L7F22_052469 [Adiantum nelumboides]|nr:hypothetical protein [Adiantum nelumboides]